MTHKIPSESFSLFDPEEDAKIKAQAVRVKALSLANKVFNSYEDLIVEEHEGSHHLSLLLKLENGKAYRVRFESVPLTTVPEWPQ